MRRTRMPARTVPLRPGRPLRRRRLLGGPTMVAGLGLLRRIVLRRDDYRCVCCGEPLDLGSWECHHRMLRSQGGGHELPNLIALAAGHHVRAHSQRTWAEQRGLIVPSYADPARTPVWWHDQGWMQPGESWTAGRPQPWQAAA